MGLTISKSESTEQLEKREKRLAYNLRKQNVRVTKKLYKIIADAYRNNWLSEFEFQSTIGFYNGMKFRYADTEEEAFAAALDKINDLVCSMLNERYNEVLKGSSGREATLLPNHLATRELSDKDVARFKKIIANSPYDRNIKI